MIAKRHILPFSSFFEQRAWEDGALSHDGADSLFWGFPRLDDLFVFSRKSAFKRMLTRISI
jgi:hypothetical protein